MGRLLKGTMSVFIVCLAMIWLSPVLLILMNATKTLLDFSQGNIWSFPTTFHFFENAKEALDAGQLGKGMISSLSYSVIGTVLSIFIAALAAYGIVILRIKGGFYWFLLIYSGTIF